jgi:hypothetical protein
MHFLIPGQGNMSLRIISEFLLFFSFSAALLAQQTMSSMPGMSMQNEKKSSEEFLMSESSGTSIDPASAPKPMIHLKAGSWNFMIHGLAFINDIQENEPCGSDKFFSTNWFMGMADRPIGKGSFMARAMVSLEPATITKRRYPELFQTGETAFGKPIVDAQHPHDLFMEISLQYARSLNERTLAYIYAAPVGDPALGPVAFPHRVSAMEIPQAALAHHVQDSTHISNEVLTGGLKYGILRLEASGFHGREPNENRWNIDYGGIDSWATRLTFTPTDNVDGQVSIGRLNHPEALEPGDVVRSTASITYNKPLSHGNCAVSVIWGRNHKTAGQQNINSYLAESVLQFSNKNYVTGRVELVDKEELFSDQPEIEELLARTAGSVFRIAAYTFGYTRDLYRFSRIRSSIGANVTLYTIPSAIKPFYGDHPVGLLFYMRFRIENVTQKQHGSHP